MTDPVIPPANDTVKELADLKAKYELQEKELSALKTQTPPKKDDSDLAGKAEAERKAKEQKDMESKGMESALKFHLASPDFLKNNATLLPPNIAGIFEQAEKENYGSAVEKAAAIKVGVVSEFFAQQGNLDQLTATQKLALEEFLKLTKTVKQERVQQIYDNIFEPTLEMLRKVKKAEALQKGIAEPNPTKDAHKEKMIKLSRQHYLGEKNA